MCDYQGYEFGAGDYPDSVCIDGMLYDADYGDGEGNLYNTGENIPCPICDPTAAIAYWTEHNKEDDDEDDGCEAYRCAVSLVNDIRANRGCPNVTL